MDNGDVSLTKELADAHKRKKTKGVAMLFQAPIHRAGFDLSKKRDKYCVLLAKHN